MNHDQPQSRSHAHALLREALTRAPDERQRFIEEVTPNEPDLRAMLSELLAAAEASGSAGFLETPAWSPRGEGASLIGRTIDGYLIQALAGTGGMGEVYRAEQVQPRRAVAFKVIRSTSPSQQSLARFALEIEALGRLRHPHIANIISAGAFDRDDQRTPYVVTEWIEGATPLFASPVVKHATLDEKFALFAKIASAMSHAHQRGVIHRDLKSANILIGIDHEPRIIDFGVALLADQTTRTTLDGQVIGSFASMSPEQCRGGREAADVRCDVYALGTLLYELIEGVPALDIASLPIAEAVRVICDVLPERPRHLPPALRDDCGTVLLTALAKDANDRYDSVDAFMRDLTNVLESRPIEHRATPLSRRVLLFARRNRTLTLASCIALCALVIGGASLAVGLVQARRATGELTVQLERMTALSAALRSMVSTNDTSSPAEAAALSDLLTAWEATLASQLESVPDVRGAIRREIGASYLALGRLEDAKRTTEAALADFARGGGLASAEALKTRLAMLRIESRNANANAMAEAYKALLPEIERILTDQPMIEVAQSDYAIALHESGKSDEAAAILEDVLARRIERRSPEDVTVAAIHNHFGRVRYGQRRYEDAERSYREAIRIDALTNGEDSLPAVAYWNNLGVVLRVTNRLDEAHEVAEMTYTIRLNKQGADHPETLATQSNVAMSLALRGDREHAATMLADCFERHRRVLGEKNQGTAIVGQNLVKTLIDLKRFEEAAKVAPAMHAISHARFGPSNPRGAFADALLGRVKSALGEETQGIALLDASLQALSDPALKANPNMVKEVRRWREESQASSSVPP